MAQEGFQLNYWILGAAVKLTLIYYHNNKDNNLILINGLEFVTVIINYCTTYNVIMTEYVTDDPHPVLFSMANTTGLPIR